MTDKKPMPDLLPCPFCGSQPEFFVACDDDFDFGSYQCTNTKCWFTQCYDEKHIARAAWNTRADLCAKDGGVNQELLTMLRRAPRNYSVGGTPAFNNQVKGWNDCLDHIISRSGSQTPTHTELLREARSAIEHLKQHNLVPTKTDDFADNVLAKLTATLKQREG